ncbi:hypothetical protein CYFUS_002512 [Cystobacter fuscus]|uniref:Uncharacterized protein n=1 Tax=Cystobacter fuscus TaxID=43 RepID=A0A250J104_9BACT|nr:hypothetical protein [Cystobacter fuscus]ATB37091.1 hypothetical protein CYFUS_002512 [Cystobacter fuscus]
MLKFSKAQLVVMGTSSEPRFHERLLEQLRAEYPEQTRQRTDALLLEEIRVAHERAKAYGFSSTPTICQFIYLGIALEARFYDDPGIAGY